MDKILIIDFGSQYCKLIARHIRKMNVFCDIIPANKDNIVEIAKHYKGIILSGGPNSVYEKNSLSINKDIFKINKPILGICYGMQIIHHLLGGKVTTLKEGEYGKVHLEITKDNELVSEVNKDSFVWMSHFDSVVNLAPGFELIGKTNLSNAIAFNKEKQIYTIQFHAEVEYSEFGKKMLENFVFKIVKAKNEWKIQNIAKNKIDEIKKIVKNEKVLLGLSGGVDSSVVAALLNKAIDKQLIPVFIDTGLMRKNEVLEVKKVFEQKLKMKLIVVDASKQFFNSLLNVEDPEKKRKIIGKLFIDEFEKVKSRFQDIKFLAQGTIYPDIIESSGKNGVAHVIKSHHNVGGLPEKLGFELCEPLKDLFKDEVRELGLQLGLPKELINRHPFPGPGLAIRIIGKITEEKVKTLQEADHIFISSLRENNLYDKVSQAAAILTNVKTVGVQGDQRTYKNLLALRVVKTTDFMTGKIAKFDLSYLEEIANKIVNKVQGVNRVVYDITSKPPATIEWE